MLIVNSYDHVSQARDAARTGDLCNLCYFVQNPESKKEHVWFNEMITGHTAIVINHLMTPTLSYSFISVPYSDFGDS